MKAGFRTKPAWSMACSLQSVTQLPCSLERYIIGHQTKFNVLFPGNSYIFSVKWLDIYPKIPFIYTLPPASEWVQPCLQWVYESARKLPRMPVGQKKTNIWGVPHYESPGKSVEMSRSMFMLHTAPGRYRLICPGKCSSNDLCATTLGASSTQCGGG